MKNQEITERLINAARRVHSILGTKYEDVHYLQALEREMKYENLIYRPGYAMDILYKGKVVGVRWVDFFVEQHLMVEIRVSETIEMYEIEILFKNLKAYNKEVGVLLNFGLNDIQFKIINNKFYKGPSNGYVAVKT